MQPSVGVHNSMVSELSSRWYFLLEHFCVEGFYNVHSLRARRRRGRSERIGRSVHAYPQDAHSR